MRKDRPAKNAEDSTGIGQLVSSQYMAWLMGVTDRALRDWAKGRGCPKETRNQWNPQAVIAWRLDSGTADSNSDATALETRIRSGTADFKEARTERERLLTEILQGKYMAAAEVEDEWVRRVVEIRASLTAMSRQIAAEFTDPEVRRSVERATAREVRNMCDQYSRTGRYTPKRSAKGHLAAT